ncbi:MAG TPA: NAD(P)-binding domain-containing protein [Bacteroidia bacterium]|nr:NAD(P)-binding domain-containing protein [Bacteroidia bacterium]HRU68085.1 NAD(P)-binding domain-containing protein [Bacteroidia bacterium]
MKVAIIGDGSWGTALTKTLFDKKEVELYWWIRQQKTYEYIVRYGRNPRYLRSVDIDLKPRFLSTDIKYVAENAEIVFIAIPSLFIRQNLSLLQASDFEGKVIVSTTKGILTHKNMLVSEYMKAHFAVPPEKYVFLTGPSHAEEVVNQMNTYLTLASVSSETASLIGNLLKTNFLNFRTSTDIKGLEYSASLKNIYAIASGVSHSLGYGDNFIAVLISNAIRETQKFLEHCCICTRNIMTSGYLGDLMVTAFSQFSRNRMFGEMIGHGYSPRAALLELNMIPEGYYSIRPFYRIARESHIEMKIVTAMYQILYEQEDPHQILEQLAEGLD